MNQPDQFELSYAGVPFLRPTGDTDGLTLSRIPLWQLREYIPTPREWVGKNLAGIAFPRPPDEPGTVVNQFFYPTGAASWSVFHGIADSRSAYLMQVATIPDDPAQKLVPQDFVVRNLTGVNLANQNQTSATTPIDVTTKMLMLPPRPISPPPDDGGAQFSTADATQALWLITLVDERYYWQWRQINVINWTVGNTNSWSGLLDVIAAALGDGVNDITINRVAIPAIYGKPSADSAFYAQFENAAVLLDAVAANIGCSVVRNFDGSYDLIEYATGIENMAKARPGTADLATISVAGGVILVADTTKEDSTRRAVLPQQVDVTFPKVAPDGTYIDPSGRQWIKNSYGLVYKKTTLLSDIFIVPNSDGSFFGSMTIHDTCRAFMPDATGAGVPTNQVNLDTLALQLSENYYYSVLASLDEVYPGILPYSPSGAADIIWTFPTSTRVQRSPYNQSVPEMQHELSAKGAATKTLGCGSCLCVVRDINGYIIGIQYPNGNGVIVSVQDCTKPPPPPPPPPVGTDPCSQGPRDGTGLCPKGYHPITGGDGSLYCYPDDPTSGLPVLKCGAVGGLNTCCCDIQLSYVCPQSFFIPGVGAAFPVLVFNFTVCNLGANGTSSITYTGQLASTWCPLTNGACSPGAMSTWGGGQVSGNCVATPCVNGNPTVFDTRLLIAALPNPIKSYCGQLPINGVVCPPGLVAVWNAATNQFNCVPP